MVLLTATPQILSALATLPPSSLSIPTSQTPLPNSPGSPISHATLITLSRLLKSHPSSAQYTLNALLRNAHPYIPPPKPATPKSPEYIALMARLRAQQEQRDYHALMAKSNPKKFTDLKSQFQLSVHDKMDPSAEEDEADDISPSLVLNILISIIMCGAASFYMTRYWHNDGVRVMLSLFVAIVVGVAEVVVYAGYLRKVKESREKERRIRERKVIIEREVVGGKGEKEMEAERIDGDVQMEEIWGRGVNGGMRRRVRERWEREKEEDSIQESD